MDLTNPFLTLTCKLGWMSMHSSSCYRFVILAKSFTIYSQRKPLKDLVLFIWKSCMVETLLTDTLISGQLYLYGHLHETPFFLTPILTLSLHSYKQPGLVTDTRFLYPEGVDSWEILLYFIKGKIYFGSSKLFFFFFLLPFFTAHLLKQLLLMKTALLYYITGTFVERSMH